MISLNRRFVFKLKILLLSGSMLNSFNFTDQIYLPQICLYINPKLKIIHFSNPDNKIDINYYNWVRKHWHA